MKEITPEMVQIRDDVLRRVCDLTGIAPQDVMSNTRRRPVVIARQMVMWALWRHPSLSTTAIGTLMGRTHALVIYSFEQIEFMRSKANIYKKVYDITQQIKDYGQPTHITS